MNNLTARQNKQTKLYEIYYIGTNNQPKYDNGQIIKGQTPKQAKQLYVALKQQNRLDQE